jgi:hypothetical protein
MNFKTLVNKTVDLVRLVMTQPTMIFRNKDNAEIVGYHVVTEDDKVRPDLIALKYYGDHTKTDMILKFNKISDPFSIMPGETLLIPSPDTAYYRLERPATFEDNIVKRQFIDTKRLSQKDQRRVEALKKKYNKETLLPPNVIPVGKKNYAFNGDKVRLGAQVQTDAVTESITAEVIASQNAENAQSQRDAILAQQGSDDEANTDGTTGTTDTKGDLITDKQAEDNLNGGSGKGDTTNATGIDGDKDDSADTTGDNNNGGDNESGSDNNTPPSDDSPCAK